MPGLKPFLKTFRRRLTGFVVRPAAWVIVRLPQKQADAVARFLGGAMYRLSRTTRERIVSNLSMVYGGSMSDRSRHEMARSVCRNLAFHVVESTRMISMTPEEIRTLVDDNNCEAILKPHLEAGRSIMIITAHYGNWELLAARIAQIAPLTVLARKNNNHHIETLITRIRETHGIRVLDRSDPKAPKEMIRMGREGGHILGVLMDQDTARIQGVFSDFMGIPALTPSGPASIAVRDLFRVFIGVLKPTGHHAHMVCLNGPVPIPREGSREENIRTLTNTFNRALSSLILEEPQYWVWNHRRWRHRPETFRC
jgi:Kdo2-lipid IVA lauroyltransferase/acyltransferase